MSTYPLVSSESARRGSRPLTSDRSFVSPLPLFATSGVVVEGDHRGRELGFPAANVKCANARWAPEGVYAGRVRRTDGSWWRSAVSLGRRETFYPGDAPILLEAYLLDFSGDLYGETLEVELLVHLRAQICFESIESLVEQLHDDVAATRTVPDSRWTSNTTTPVAAWAPGAVGVRRSR